MQKGFNEGWCPVVVKEPYAGLIFRQNFSFASQVSATSNLFSKHLAYYSSKLERFQERVLRALQNNKQGICKQLLKTVGLHDGQKRLQDITIIMYKVFFSFLFIY